MIANNCRTRTRRYRPGRNSSALQERSARLGFVFYVRLQRHGISNTRSAQSIQVDRRYRWLLDGDRLIRIIVLQVPEDGHRVVGVAKIIPESTQAQLVEQPRPHQERYETPRLPLGDGGL
jgi:hypothetical protein